MGRALIGVATGSRTHEHRYADRVGRAALSANWRSGEMLELGGGRSKSAFEIMSCKRVGCFVLARGNEEVCGEEATKVRRRIGPLQRLIDLL